MATCWMVGASSSCSRAACFASKLGSGPVNSVIPAWDFTCGLHAALGLLAAERHRRLTGDGQLIRLSLFNVGAALAAALGYTAEVEVNGAERPRLGNAIFGTFGRDFATSDGKRLMVAVVTGRQMEDLAPRCLALQRRLARRRAAQLQGFSSRSRSALLP